jgi:argininosuccinate synthase
MIERIVLAYAGTPACSAAVTWLGERHAAGVVTVTVDVGQTDDLDAVRARALACGAVRAHVIDARDVFARDYVIPALRAGAEPPLATLAHPLIARTLVDLAQIETATAVAHASSGTTLDASVAAINPTLRTVAPAREARKAGLAEAEDARAPLLPAGNPRHPHLLIRRAIDPARAASDDVVLTISFERRLPVAVNGVSMALPELIECLSLIGGLRGIGYGDALPAPAVAILRAAYAAAGDSDTTARLRLHAGACAVLTAPTPELVNHP